MSKRDTSDSSGDWGIDLKKYERTRATLTTEQQVDILWSVTENQTRKINEQTQEINKLRSIVTWGTGFASALSITLGGFLALVGSGIISFGAGK